ncbi:MAG: SRPBCC domain-containing protein [Alicyclobacillus sp.]|nr:SRPBCC domain-containing protein [Alicyclobacillus sp.]
MNVKREILIKTAPARVWSMLTDPHELARWAGESAIVTDAVYQIQGSTVFTGQLGGELMTREEGKLLHFRWRIGKVDTVVKVHVIEEPQAGSPPGVFTKVMVEHEGVPEDILPGVRTGSDTMDAVWALWLRHLALWAERARVPGRFDYQSPLSAMVQRSIVIEADVASVWPYLVDPHLRTSWFNEPLGRELERIERRSVTFEWLQDVPGTVTFHLEPMPEDHTLVLVEHVGLRDDLLFNYHLGWQDYLVALTRAADMPLIRQSVWIHATVEQVWQWFTTERALQTWWNATTRADVRIGGDFRFSDHGADLIGRITDIVPNQRFAFTFLEEGTEGVRDPFVIVIELHAEGEGTRVTVTQSGFDRLPEDIRTRVFEAFQRRWSDSWELHRLAQTVQATN